METLLLPTDLTPAPAEAALAAARRLGLRARRLVLLHVVEESLVEAMTNGYALTARSREEAREEVLDVLLGEAREALDRMAERFREVAGSVETSLRVGRAQEEIVRAADELNADLILMPSKSKLDVSSVVIGSVTARVLASTSRPVLVVKVGHGGSG